MEVETVIIEDKEYIVLAKIKKNNFLYYCLIAGEKADNFMIRKLLNENGEEFLVGLDNEEEFNSVLKEYVKIMQKTKEKF